MNHPWTAREVESQDRILQLRLFNLCFGKDKTVDTLLWKYERNPHGRALERVALDEDDQVVGSYAYVPRRFRWNGRSVVLMQASDAVVDPIARRMGIFSGLDQLVARTAGALGVPLAFAYSGRLSYEGFLKNGWRVHGAARLWRYRFRSRRGLLRLGAPGRMAALAAPLVDALWARRDRRRARGADAVARLTPLARFGAEADELFEATVPGRGLIGERDSAWLNWRYVDTPTQRQERFALWTAGGRLDGWLVAEFVGGQGYLVDHLARDEQARSTLLQAFTLMAHARGMEEATGLLFDHDPATPVLAALGWSRPTRRKPFRDRFPFIVRACRPDGDQEAEPLEAWHLSDGDRDAEHLSP